MFVLNSGDPASPMMKPIIASIARRPCFSSDSRQRFISSLEMYSFVARFKGSK